MLHAPRVHRSASASLLIKRSEAFCALIVNRYPITIRIGKRQIVSPCPHALLFYGRQSSLALFHFAIVWRFVRRETHFAGMKSDILLARARYNATASAVMKHKKNFHIETEIRQKVYAAAVTPGECVRELGGAAAVGTHSAYHFRTKAKQQLSCRIINMNFYGLYN